MKTFNKSIIGSFRMPEEALTPAVGELKRNEANPEEWCVAKTDYSHVSYSLGPVDLSAIGGSQFADYHKANIVNKLVESEDYHLNSDLSCCECKITIRGGITGLGSVCAIGSSLYIDSPHVCEMKKESREDAINDAYRQIMALSPEKQKELEDYIVAKELENMPFADSNITQTEHECRRHIREYSKYKEGPPARHDSKNNVYVTYAWRGGDPRELSDQFLRFMQGIYAVTSAVKPEGEAVTQRKVMCEIRTWPEIIKDGDTYLLRFRASFYPEG